MKETRRFNVFDFDIQYGLRPSSDKYRETLPKSIELSVPVPDYFDDLPLFDQTEILKEPVMLALEERVLFDTPDEPEFEIVDIDFCFEKVID
jgi:hypothetical protein